ncbi:MAG: transporter [Flavobacteriales bacterium]|nr:transporter [Flavobacteriales bacterium]|tara:strand:+ start:78 stop:833 length:756 start_codon:yes stop_codon:yes gene_type:complete
MLLNIESNLKQFKSISLDEIKSVNLMNRMDTKFVFSIKKLNELLVALRQYYNILKVDKKIIQEYKSLYYDTFDRIFYLNHHNNRVNRFKVRFREYVDSELVFLEVKFKNNKRKTLKKRIKVDEIPNSLSIEQMNYLERIIGKKMNLIAHQWINFNRVTLVDKLNKERLTIDLNLNFSNKFKSEDHSDIVIAEVKQDKSNNMSFFTRIAKKNNIKPTRLSKYCISTISLSPEIKYNRFKEKLLFINKLKKLI